MGQKVVLVEAWALRSELRGLDTDQGGVLDTPELWSRFLSHKHEEKASEHSLKFVCMF